ncbi:MAG: hypothetical protein AAF438_13980, partial [Pseudomonadota bacterium]
QANRAGANVPNSDIGSLARDAESIQPSHFATNAARYGHHQQNSFTTIINQASNFSSGDHRSFDGLDARFDIR